MKRTSVTRKTLSASFLPLWAFIMLVLFSAPGLPAYASEGATSSFTPGAQGDFGLNYYPPGLYFRENIVYTDGTVRNYPAATQDSGMGFNVPINSKLKSTVWFDLFQVMYSSNTKLLGGRYFAFVNIPVGFDADLKADLRVPAIPALGSPQTDVGSLKDQTSGLGDIQAVPFGIIWDLDAIHILAAQNVVLPTGRYEVSKLVNMGRNYFSYDEILGVTWLDEKGGHEVSFMAGYMINTKNQATDYKTGDEFHVDYTLSQYLSKQFGFGLVGYYYQQMKDDESPALDAYNETSTALGLSSRDGYKSKGAAAGPAIMYAPEIGGKEVNIIAKWLYEYYARNRFKGNWVYLSAVVKF